MGSPEENDTEVVGGGGENPPTLDNVKPDVGSDGVEAKETEPKLRLTVDQPCKNPEGNYIGLSAVQRQKLGVDVGDSVVLQQPGGKVLGVFTVGFGLKALAGRAERFSANGVDPGTEVEVVKKSIENSVLKLPVSFGVESDSRHERRSGIISERFGDQGFDGTSYLVVPTAVAKTMNLVTPSKQTSKPTVLSISLGKVKIGDDVKTVVIVPSGNQFGVTTAMASDLKIATSNFSEVIFGVRGGVFVVDQFK